MANVPEFQPNLIDDEPPFLLKYWLPLTVAVLAIAAVLVYFTTQDMNRAAQLEKISTAYTEAKDNAAKFQVLQSNPGVPLLAPDALELASKQVETKDYKGAVATYEFFIKNYASSEFINAARLGLASALEADGQTDAALDAYQKTASAGYPNLYAPLASLNAARLLLAKKDFKSAKSLLDPLLAGNGSVAGDARELLKKIPAS